MRGAFTVDRFTNRLWDYPAVTRGIAGSFDVFHIVDHSYAHLVHTLPSDRTLVTCHDLDTFRSILEPAHDVRSFMFRAMTRRIFAGLRSAGHVACDTEATRDALVARGRRRPGADERGAERPAPKLHAGRRTRGRCGSGAPARSGGPDDGIAARRQHDCAQAHRRAASGRRRGPPGAAGCSARPGRRAVHRRAAGARPRSRPRTRSLSSCRSSIGPRWRPSTAAARSCCCRPNARDSACRCSRRWPAERRSWRATSMRCVRSAVTPFSIARPRTSRPGRRRSRAALSERGERPAAVDCTGAARAASGQPRSAGHATRREVAALYTRLASPAAAPTLMARGAIRVVHVGKFYPPVAGGMERVLESLCEDAAPDGRQPRHRLQHRRARPSARTCDGVHVTRVGHRRERRIGAARSIAGRRDAPRRRGPDGHPRAQSVGAAVAHALRG